MGLKELAILGFKSFADKTVFKFHKGITGIVGPNGCGKSNIADAFRWVLGEQSARSMRGGNMKDVIFAGTDKRKPLNFAEVTICMTDVKGYLPIDYEEVSITRRLHRNGESEYLINNQPARLKDVQGLFLDSGVGKNAFSVFEQGKMDQVIQNTPIERRVIFEEAAGILRFLKSKNEAIRRLEQMETNVSRLNDIHGEVLKRIAVLEEQAQKAREYNSQKLLLERLEKGALVQRFEMLAQKLQEALEKEDKANGDNVSVEAQQQEKVLFLEKAKADLIAKEKIFREKSEEVYRRRSDKEIAFRESHLNTERIKETLSKQKRWQRDLEELLVRKQERLKSSTKQNALLMEKEKLLIESTNELQEYRQQTKKIEEILSELRAQLNAAQNERLQLVQNENRAESDLRQQTVKRESAIERQVYIQEKHEKLKAICDDLKQKIAAKREEMEAAQIVVEEQQHQFKSIEQDLDAIEKDITRHISLLEGYSKECTELQARHSALLHLRMDMEGFSAGSKKLMQQSEDVNSPLYNKIKGMYEFFIPQKGEEDALTAILKNYAHTLVVEKFVDMEIVLDLAKVNAITDFSLICPEMIVGKEKAKKTLDVFATSTNEDLSRCLLSNIKRMDNLEEAIKLYNDGYQGQIWIQQGIHIDAYGVIFMGGQEQQSVFKREAEINELAEKIEQTTKAKQAVEVVLENLREKKGRLQQKRIEIDKQVRKLEMTLMEINFILQRSNGDLNKNENEFNEQSSEIKQLQRAIEELTISIASITHMKAQMQKQSKAAEERLQSLLISVEENDERCKKQQSYLSELITIHNQIESEVTELRHSLKVIEAQETQSENQRERLEEEIAAANELMEQFENMGEAYSKSLEELDVVLTEITLTCKKYDDEVSKCKDNIVVIEQQIEELRIQQKKFDSALHQTGILKAQIEVAQKSVERELKEKYSLTIDQAKALNIELEKSLEVVEKEVKALRSDLESRTDINMTAIEECEKHKQRHQFLQQQVDDLGLSRDELLKMIAELDDQSRSQFKTTFDQIRANFRKNFSILFTGGEADLMFTETSDILEAGIEIIARPPGKQMRAISLLSGGEKCLTAMALLFALFEVKPAPFCILDEIDAPLDDSNVERFVNMVKHFADRCQFIIITHNKRTMAIADRLFGVSMQERGVTKILSMEFSSEDAPATEVEPVYVGV